jgi:hypothetical protein
VPEISADSFKKIVRASEAYKKDDKLLDSILERIEFEVFEEHA